MPEIIKNKYGYYEVVKKPSSAELEEYYSKSYYQHGASKSYDVNYGEEEKLYFTNKIKEKLHVVNQFTSLNSSTRVIDIGCGEGWLLKFLKDRGIPVIGIDYSKFACQKFNPDCLSDFVEGDIYSTLHKFQSQGLRFELIWLDNVLEHVIDPRDVLRICCSLLTDSGVLMVEVPNDFSLIQKYLLDNGLIDKEFWVVFPDHLSYFNREGLKALAHEVKLKEVFAMGDFPIDINLLNENTNYRKDKAKGKSCYEAKYRFENLINSVSIPQSVAFYKSLIELGVGRCLISFFTRE